MMRLRFPADAKLFWISDQHFGHKNIIKYSERPYQVDGKDSLQLMHKSFIENWNNTVPDDGIVFILGDFAFMQEDEAVAILKQLKGVKYFIPGNHDHTSILKAFRDHVAKIADYGEIKLDDGTLIVMSHYPFLEWKNCHHGSWMLHGHCHGNAKYTGNFKLYDVGVDVNNFKPISLAELRVIMDKRDVLSHH